MNKKNNDPRKSSLPPIKTSEAQEKVENASRVRRSSAVSLSPMLSPKSKAPDTVSLASIRTVHAKNKLAEEFIEVLSVKKSHSLPPLNLSASKSEKSLADRVESLPPRAPTDSEKDLSNKMTKPKSTKWSRIKKLHGQILPPLETYDSVSKQVKESKSKSAISVDSENGPNGSNNRPESVVKYLKGSQDSAQYSEDVGLETQVPSSASYDSTVTKHFPTQFESSAKPTTEEPKTDRPPSTASYDSPLIKQFPTHFQSFAKPTAEEPKTDRPPSAASYDSPLVKQFSAQFQLSAKPTAEEPKSDRPPSAASYDSPTVTHPPAQIQAPAPIGTLETTHKEAPGEIELDRPPTAASYDSPIIQFPPSKPQFVKPKTVVQNAGITSKEQASIPHDSPKIKTSFHSNLNRQPAIPILTTVLPTYAEVTRVPTKNDHLGPTSSRPSTAGTAVYNVPTEQHFPLPSTSKIPTGTKLNSVITRFSQPFLNEETPSEASYEPPEDYLETTEDIFDDETERILTIAENYHDERGCSVDKKKKGEKLTALTLDFVDDSYLLDEFETAKVHQTESSTRTKVRVRFHVKRPEEPLYINFHVNRPIYRKEVRKLGPKQKFPKPGKFRINPVYHF